MALARGTHVGGYQIVAPLGRGGMGEVYRAHDPKLRRDVALKVLPDSFANDHDRVARFQREAEVLASLNHPHIGSIYGLEDMGSSKALVLELVEGATLAERIARGPLPMIEAWPIARQIADALDAAHTQGIIHRDLKPSNIKVKDDGTVKVLDFGLAKALEPTSRGAVAESPTVTSPAMTQAGVLLGTAAYMSPEQAKGRLLDKRSDIWAFGCVLYEMLAGRRAFDGDGIADVLGAVMRLEPDWDALAGAVPPGVHAVVKRCLQKDPTLRIRDIADVRFEIDEALAAAASAPSGAVARGRYAAWAVAALSTAAAGVAVAMLVGRVPAAPPEARLQIVTPRTGDAFAFAVSPDGLHLVYQAGEAPPQLWLRPLGPDIARPLAGTEPCRSS